jgi:hypothetical protein
MSTEPGAGVLTALAELIVGVANLARADAQNTRAAKAAKREARRAEKRAEAQWQEWMGAIARQSARVSAGDASRKDARALLGGRRNRAR